MPQACIEHKPQLIRSASHNQGAEIPRIVEHVREYWRILLCILSSEGPRGAPAEPESAIGVGGIDEAKASPLTGVVIYECNGEIERV
jgi:hypothetical protein